MDILPGKLKQIEISKFIGSWLVFFSISLPLQIALVIDFSVQLKITNSFYLRHHALISYSIADLTELKINPSFHF